MTNSEPRAVTAGLLLIGDELLSGRTQDANTAHIAARLNEAGVHLAEVRIVADHAPSIAAAVNALRAAYDYVFTTGGIGPTHDDITSASVALAFGVPCTIHPEAYALMDRHYAPGEFTAARQRMAMTPQGASLIDNPVSRAPGFRIGNVFVMAGIPRVMHAMLENALPQLAGGRTMLSAGFDVFLPEGRFGAELGAVQKLFPRVSIGSYPFHRDGRYGASLILRATDAQLLAEAAAAVEALMTELGGAPVAITP